MRHIPRLYCPNLEDETFEIPEFQVRHVISVLRLKEGDNLLAFNPSAGEWLCHIESIQKKRVLAKKLKLVRLANESIGLALAFCPIKPDKIKLIIEKGTELGVTDFYPIISRYTNSKLNIEKAHTISIQASEQSERLHIPIIHEEASLVEFINNLPQKFTWVSAIERNLTNVKGLPALDMLGKNFGFIVGPEGGFSEEEKTLLCERTISATISKNILRSETAVITCLAVFNAANVSDYR